MAIWLPAPTLLGHVVPLLGALAGERRTRPPTSPVLGFDASAERAPTAAWPVTSAGPEQVAGGDVLAVSTSFSGQDHRGLVVASSSSRRGGASSRSMGAWLVGWCVGGRRRRPGRRWSPPWSGRRRGGGGGRGRRVSAGSCWRTGRNSSWAVWPTTSRARSRFFTPGSETMIDVALAGDVGLGHAQGVDPVADDLDGLVEDALEAPPPRGWSTTEAPPWRSRPSCGRCRRSAWRPGRRWPGRRTRSGRRPSGASEPDVGGSHGVTSVVLVTVVR